MHQLSSIFHCHGYSASPSISSLEVYREALELTRQLLWPSAVDTPWAIIPVVKLETSLSHLCHCQLQPFNSHWPPISTNISLLIPCRTVPCILPSPMLRYAGRIPSMYFTARSFILVSTSLTLMTPSRFSTTQYHEAWSYAIPALFRLPSTGFYYFICNFTPT